MVDSGHCQMDIGDEREFSRFYDYTNRYVRGAGFNESDSDAYQILGRTQDEIESENGFSIIDKSDFSESFQIVDDESEF